MKRLPIVVLFPVMILFSQRFFAQEAAAKFQVDYNEINGELTSKDLFKKDFGRYKGFEIELYEDELINFVVFSKNFQPGIALVNPQGEIFKQSSGNGNGYANMITAVPSPGSWIVYIIGKENSFGKYQLQISIAEPNALVLDSTADFCTSLAFLIAHSNAYFYLLENAIEKKTARLWLKDASDEFFDEDDGSYNALYYSGNENFKAESVFKKMSEKISACFSGWLSKSVGWNKTDDFKVKSIIFTENVKGKPRYVKVSIYDMQGSKQKYQNRFEVYVQVNRKR